jgi:4-alpha-glucanotransferase
MKFPRSAGVLLHPTSLPGPDGIGDLGPEAYRWVDFLADSSCGLWQILPLGPTGYGDSPYQSFSAFAGNHYLASAELLLDEGLLTEKDLRDRPDFPAEEVDYGAALPWKNALLDRAYQAFLKSASLQEEFEEFQQKHKSWLTDYALFLAIKEAHGGAPWTEWPSALLGREQKALDAARETYRASVQTNAFRQFLFFRQWDSLKAYAAARGVRIIGDIPIYVSHDSADVWANPHLFDLDERGEPNFVAGVPPDYFSVTGQLWGNPLYRWDVHAADGYAWWTARFKSALSMVDAIRLDHFRGFAGYWVIPAGAPTAEKGSWEPGPGERFFVSLKRSLGELPLIAEDLGEITPDVIELRDRFALPGMKIFQFGFTGERNHEFLPHTYPQNCVAYTGTHDNDTARSWYENANWRERRFCRKYLSIRKAGQAAPAMIEKLWESKADQVVAPMQDFLNLGTHARMNYPSRPHGNWRWRMPAGALSETLSARLTELNEQANRKLQKIGK